MICLVIGLTLYLLCMLINVLGALTNLLNLACFGVATSGDDRHGHGGHKGKQVAEGELGHGAIIGDGVRLLGWRK